MSKHLLLTGCALGVLLSLAEPAAAQTSATPAASNEDSAQLTEIVVTAQRRVQNLQDTPVAVSAFDQETLRDSGVTNIRELAQLAPSLQVANTAGVYLPFLRGVGNNNGSVGNESSVATYIDDVYYTRLSVAYLNLGTVDRIEVLNGPQGTLFGRNSSGGAIQMFSRDPGMARALEASVGYANYDTRSGQIYASTPITDTLLFNVAAGGSDQRNGWGRNLTTGQDVNLGWNWTVRSKLIWEPTDRTRFKLVGFYTRSRTDIGSVQDFYPGTFGLTPAPGLPGYPNPALVIPSLKESSDTFYDTRLSERADSREKGYGGSLRIDQDLGFADLVSITAYRESEGNYHVDLDFSPTPFYSADLGNFENQFTQEFQLKSKPSEAVSWILGAYYLHWKAGYDPGVGYGDIFNATIARGATINLDGRQTVNSYSGYAQATVPVNAQTNVTAGARYTRDELSARGEQFLAIPGVGNVPAAPAGLANPYTDEDISSAFTYRVALDHQFTEDIMGYASVSKGYKSGAYNTLPVSTPPAKPEIVQAYEVGLKSELFDRRVRVNGALFWSDIKNPQVLTTVNSGNISSVSLTNGQKARSRGFEVAVDAVAARGLKLRGAVTYLDAEYTRFLNAPIFSGGKTPGSVITGPVLGDASGNRLANVPKWRLSAGANYKVETEMGEWVADLSVSHTDKHPWTADNRLWAKPVTLVNASVSLTPATADWLTLSVWGKNLGKGRYFLIGQETAGPANTGGYPTSPAPPRTYGATVTAKF